MLTELQKNSTYFLHEPSLFQIVLHSSTSVERDHINELERYGLIKLTEDESYIAYSDHFRDYLCELQDTAKTQSKSTSTSEPLGTNHQISEHPTESTSTLGSLGPSYQSHISTREIWKRTENALRKTITTIMSSTPGFECDRWIDKVSKIDKTLEDIFTGCSGRRKLNAANYPGENNDLPDLINFTQPSDPFNIILHEKLWQYFREFFGKNDPNTDEEWLNYWRHAEKIILKRFRNLDSHSNEFIPEYDRQISEGYCKQILAICDKVEESKSSEQNQYAESRTVQPEEVSHGLNIVDQDRKQIEQEVSEQEQLYKGKVCAVNQAEAYANIDIYEHSFLKWIQVSRGDFQNEDAFKAGENVKFKIEETGNGPQIRNVDLAESE